MAVFDLVMGVPVFRVDRRKREDLARIVPQIRQDMIAACRDAPASRFVEHALKAIE